MNLHRHQLIETQVDQPSVDIFRFPTRAETLRAREHRQELEAAKIKEKETNYKDEDLSGCLSGSLDHKKLDRFSSREASPTKIKEKETNYKDEDLSGCLSGCLKSKPSESHRGRSRLTQRDKKTGEVELIEQNDLSDAISELNEGIEEKSGWLYFN